MQILKGQGVVVGGAEGVRVEVGSGVENVVAKFSKAKRKIAKRILKSLMVGPMNFEKSLDRLSRPRPCYS